MVRITYIFLIMFLPVCFTHAALQPHVHQEVSPNVSKSTETEVIRKEKAKKLLEEAAGFYATHPRWVLSEIVKPYGYFTNIQGGGIMSYIKPDGFSYNPKFRTGTSVHITDVTSLHDPGHGNRIWKTVQALLPGESGEMEVGINYNHATGKPSFTHLYFQKMPDGIVLFSSANLDKKPKTNEMDAAYLQKMFMPSGPNE